MYLCIHLYYFLIYEHYHSGNYFTASAGKTVILMLRWKSQSKLLLEIGAVCMIEFNFMLFAVLFIFFHQELTRMAAEVKV